MAVCAKVATILPSWSPTGWPRAKRGGSFEDLNRWQQRIPIPDWPAGWARSLARPVVFGDVWTSLPWHDGPECLVYRSDLFSDPGRQAAFRAQFGRQLGPPATWEEFEETARFFTDPRAKLYGTVFAAFPDGHNTLYDFALQLWSRGGELLDRGWKPEYQCARGRSRTRFLSSHRVVIRHSATRARRNSIQPNPATCLSRARWP